MSNQVNNEAIHIKTLHFPEAQHKRPGMYTDTSSPNSTTREVVDNGLDEADAGYCNNIRININNSGSPYAVVSDDGRGIPLYEKDGKNVIIDILTNAHTGGKFDMKKTVDREIYSIGMNGIGQKITNALAKNYFVLVNIKKSYESSYRAGFSFSDEIMDAVNNMDKPVFLNHYKLGYANELGIYEFNDLKDRLKDYNTYGNLDELNWSTLTIYEPSEDFFETTKIKYDVRELKLAKSDNPKLSIKLNDKEIDTFDVTKDSFSSTNFIDDKVFNFEFKVPAHLWDKEITDNEEITKLSHRDYEHFNPISRFKIAFGFSNNDFSSVTDGSVVKLTTGSGAHIKYSMDAMGIILSEVYPNLDASDIKYGLRLFTLFYAHNDQLVYTGQNKEGLRTIKGYSKTMMIDSMRPVFKNLVKSNKEFFDALVARIMDYKSTMGKLSTKKYIDNLGLINYSEDTRSAVAGVHIYECSSRDMSLRELHICEGKSASGGLLKARGGLPHVAVLPLRGKAKNSSNLDLEEALQNPELVSMLKAIGVGITPYVDLSKARYNKIIIDTDADVDGKHIRALILATYGTHLPELIEAGMLYIAVAPLYKQGDKYIWEFNEDELDKNKKFDRFKGLGSTSPKILRETMLDNKNRILIKVTNHEIENALHLLRSATAKRNLMVANGIVEL